VEAQNQRSEPKPIKQHVKYIGAKPSVEVQFPIPFISKSAADGPPVTFYHNKPVPLTPEQANQLCKTAGGVFVMCDEQGKGVKA
jgi:hypothetical protein